MPTVQDLFKSKKNDLYGKSSNILIETRGIVNVPRAAALLTSSPNTLADLIGNQIGGALGGNANRPTDTIFKKDGAFNKPVSLLAPTNGLLRRAVKEGTNYYIKDHPAPASVAGKILGGASPASVAKDLAFKALQNTDDLKGLVNGILGKGKEGTGYGPQYHRTQIGEKGYIKTEDKKAMFSTHYIKYTPKKNKTTGVQEYVRGAIAKRENTRTVAGVSQWDIINREILNSGTRTRGEIKEKFLDKNKKMDVPYMLIEHYGKKDDTFKGDILLPGTISGITETATPNVSSFKYVGSPFNLYRYGGVERTLAWSVKLYYTDMETKLNMINNLDRLRRLVFPDEDISTITYGGAEANGNSPMLYNPNLVYVTIGDVYTKMFGIIDTLSITIDDATPWATPSNNTGEGRTNLYGLNTPHPIIMDVAMSMKLIENPKISKKDKDSKYDYSNYFTATGAETYLKDNVEKKERLEIAKQKQIETDKKLTEKTAAANI
jgi:hypothetical protein